MSLVTVYACRCWSRWIWPTGIWNASPWCWTWTRRQWLPTSSLASSIQTPVNGKMVSVPVMAACYWIGKNAPYLIGFGDLAPAMLCTSYFRLSIATITCEERDFMRHKSVLGFPFDLFQTSGLVKFLRQCPSEVGPSWISNFTCSRYPHCVQVSSRLPWETLPKLPTTVQSGLCWMVILTRCGLSHSTQSWMTTRYGYKHTVIAWLVERHVSWEQWHFRPLEEWWAGPWWIL